MKIYFGLLQEGRFLGSSICSSLGLSEKYNYYEKHMFCEIWKIVFCAVDFGLLQEGLFLCSSIRCSLGHSEKRIFCFLRPLLGNDLAITNAMKCCNKNNIFLSLHTFHTLYAKDGDARRQKTNSLYMESITSCAQFLERGFNSYLQHFVKIVIHSPHLSV